jgi:hypothetical protein
VLAQKAGELPFPAALRQSRGALVAYRTARLKQFGGRLTLVQIDGLGLMAGWWQRLTLLSPRGSTARLCLGFQRQQHCQ